MRKSAIFRSLCAVMVWIYLAASVQAGQVVTPEERSLAKEAVSFAKSEKNLEALSSTNTVAVLSFHNKTGREELNVLQKGMALMLITDLAKVPELQVVERIKVQALLDEMALGSSGLVDRATAPKVGKILGAYHISTGDINSGKITEMKITPFLVDVPFETATAQTATGGSAKDLFRMEKEILFGIIEQMKIFLTAEKRAELNEPLAASPAAALAFFAAIDLSDQGKYEEAAQALRKALAEDPNFTLAKDTLQELQTLGLSKPTTTKSTTPEPVTDEGISTGTIVLGTVVVLAAGGAVALALSSSDDSDGDGDNNSTASGPVFTVTSPSDGNLNTSSIKGGSSCSYGTLLFTSDTTLQADGAGCAATIVPSAPTGWTAGTVFITNDRILNVPYSAASTTTCLTVDSMRTTISGCRDTKGNTMTSQSFTFRNNY